MASGAAALLVGPGAAAAVSGGFLAAVLAAGLSLAGRSRAEAAASTAALGGLTAAESYLVVDKLIEFNTSGAQPFLQHACVVALNQGDCRNRKTKGRRPAKYIVDTGAPIIQQQLTVLTSNCISE